MSLNGAKTNAGAARLQKIVYRRIRLWYGILIQVSERSTLEDRIRVLCGRAVSALEPELQPNSGRAEIRSSGAYSACAKNDCRDAVAEDH